jgi:hypothetical protein
LRETGTVVAVHDMRNGALSKPPSGSWWSLAAQRRNALAAPQRRALAAPQRLVLVGMMAPAAWLLAGCAAGGDLMGTVAVLPQQANGYAGASDMPMAADVGRLSGTPQLTPSQRDYLGALAAAGIRPSSDLRALGIGAYVCQARAAGQSEQTVWESVAPMVRSDVVATNAAVPQSVDPQAPQLAAKATDNDVVVRNVIRIATGRLC